MTLDALLALLPLAVVVVLMVGRRWNAARAGMAGWLLACLVGAARFGAGPFVWWVAAGKSLLQALDVLLIVWAAYLLYRVTDEAGAIAGLAEALRRLTADREMQALLIGWAFATFLQGVGGFGVPVAVTAPLLAGLGFTPMAAVVIPSIGHAWGVTFGSLASSFQAMLAATGLQPQAIAPASALVLGVVGLGCGFGAAQAAGGWRAARRLALPILALGSAMAAAHFLLATRGLWTIATLGAGLVGLGVGVPLASWRRGGQPPRAVGDLRRGWPALAGYLAAIAVILTVQGVPPVRAALGRVVIQVAFPEVRTALGRVTPAGPGRPIAPFSHTGVVLGYACLAAYLVYRRFDLYRPGAAGRMLRQTAVQMAPTSVGILTLIAMAGVMEHAGMIDVLAQGLAGGAGGLFPLASAWIGALGAFVTGSNTNSNVLFAMLQRRTAEMLRLDVALTLAAQNAGGALGSVISPAKVVVGASTTTMGGREGEVMRALAVPIGVLTAGVSLAMWLLLRFAGP